MLVVRKPLNKMLFLFMVTAVQASKGKLELFLEIVQLKVGFQITTGATTTEPSLMMLFSPDETQTDGMST